MAERSEAVEEQAVRDASAGYLAEAEIATAEDVPPGYKWTEVGVIPEDWETVALGEGVSLLSGHHVMASFCNTTGHGVPYLTGPADFPDGHIQQTRFTTKPTTICEAGDLLLTVKGSGAGTLVKSDADYCISRQLMAIHVEKWDPDFTFYSLLENASTLSDAVTGLIPGLSRGDVLSQVLPIPTEEKEQRAIATALSDADALIESLDRLIAKKRAIKQAAMQQLLTGQTRLPGFTGEWETKRLGDVASFHKGSGLSKADLLADGSDPCIHYGELFTRYGERITSVKNRTDRKAACFRSFENDVLMPTSDVTPNGLATASCIEESNVILGGDILIIRPNGAEIDGTFLAYKIRMDHRQIMQLVSGTTVFHIYGRDMAEFTYKAPMTEEQQAIVSVLSDMDNEIEALERRRDKVRQTKQGMMQQLLTGHVRLVASQSTEPAAC